MSELIITICGNEDYVYDSIQMEDNYLGMHKKVIWEQTDRPGFFFGIHWYPKRILEDKHRKLVESFRRKRDNPDKAEDIDRIALDNEIKVRYDIVPLNTKRYDERSRCLNIGDLASNGIDFDITNDRENGSMDYNGPVSSSEPFKRLFEKRNLEYVSSNI